MSEEFDLFGDDGADNEEYQKLIAEKKAAAAEAEKAKTAEKKKKEVVMKSSIAWNIRPADSDVRLARFCDS